MRSKLAAVILCAATAGCGTDKVPDDGTNHPFEADPPAVYVAKVKNILVGLPPTDAEVAAVQADPDAIGGLVDGWMQLPEYQQKMTVFFELAFQQTQITALDFVALVPSRGLGTGRGLPLLTQNATQSFARTMLQLDAEGRPLTDAFTTKRVMMTPALMSLYAFLDTRTVDDDGVASDKFAKANPGLKITIEASQGPIPIEQTLDPTSPNYMHWYNPDLPTMKYGDPTCNGQDPIVFTGSALFYEQMLFGEIPNHQGPNGQCTNKSGGANSVMFAPTDFTAWKMVTIRKPAQGEQITQFYDLKTLRDSDELVLTTQRPGFYSTPAFFANWPTNASNQHRVTLNQALIVATGAQVDGTDTTQPDSTPGLDQTHTIEACIGCHQLLDPTRSIFSATYSWFGYPQTDGALKAQPGQFAFMNVIQPMAKLDDFGQILTTHPLVPNAWAQKLCFYVNSAPCDADDPELLRILDKFKSSNMSWNVLVRELMASPITTHASETKTFTTNGGVIAVARRDHLCASINSRLGMVDICQLDATLANPRQMQQKSTIASIVAGLPSDGYGRGATEPVLPNQPTLFYRAGLENICEALAVATIDATADPKQPGAKQWSSSQPDAAIAEFVSIVMALTSGDERTPQVTSVLKSHFDAAKAQGESATDALRSTFTAACLSPSFIGIGL